MPWWKDRVSLASFVTDLVQGELSRMRPGQPLPPRPWPDSLELGESGLGCDSLERLTLASALGQALRLDRSGLEDHLLARGTLGAWIDLAEICLGRYDESMVFVTSGSTGVPKPCEHRLDDLLQEAESLGGILAGARRIVACVSSRHIYGFLFTILLPAALDIPVIRLLGKSTVGLERDLLSGDVVIGFPDFWTLASRSVTSFPPGIIGVTSTAPLPPPLDAILAGAGLERLVEIYGSSETAGIGWREAPSPDFRLFPFWTRSPDGEALLRSSSGGLISHIPQDHLHWTAEGNFRPAGRRDHAFQVGGVNVHPRRVEAILAQHPGVAEVSIRRMRPEEGNRVKAFIVPKDSAADEADLARDLELLAREHLAAAERPKSFRFGPALPRDSLGKMVDWEIEAGE